jgi:trimethylamine:corrinoid methyltransferase-like protein
MRVQCQILSEDEQQKIHDDSIRILEQIGTQFMSHRASASGV